MDINELKTALFAGPVTINFTKVNGHKRTMLATLAADLLPPPHPEKSNTTKDMNLLIVHDIQMNGWRTVKVDSISDWAAGDSTGEQPVEAQAQVPAPIGWTPNTPTP